jgi:Na+/H+ antiporter NhaD/arsenite permease-like protein
MIPLGLHLAKVLGVNRLPILFMQMIASHLGGAASLTGNPVNMMIGLQADFSYVFILLHLGLPVLVIAAVCAAVLAQVYKSGLLLGAKPEAVMSLKAVQYIKNRSLLNKCAVVWGLTLFSFLLHHWLPVSPGCIAVAAAFVLLMLSRKQYHYRELVEDVDWKTIFFFIGLFVVTGGLTEAGVVSRLAGSAAEMAAGNVTLLSVITLWVSAILSSAVDPYPFAALMVQIIPFLKGELGRLSDPAKLHSIWWALALGSAFGGSATLYGAATNVIAAGMAARQELRVTFADYAKIGVPIAILSLVLATLYLLL